MERRTFVKLSAAVAGAALGTPIISACARVFPEGEAPLKASVAPATAPSPSLPPTPTAIQPATAQPTADMRGRVVLVRTDDRAAGIRTAVEWLEPAPLRGKRLFLKPNLNSADAFPGSTHIETLSELVKLLEGMDPASITIGDRSGMGDTGAVMRQKGIDTLAAELGLETVVLDDLGGDGWVLFQPEDSHWSQGFALARPLLEADAVIQTCCLKTHRYGGHFTFSLKNSVGAAAKSIPGHGHNFMNELHASSFQREMIAEINQAYQPDLILLDGMEAFVDGGPDWGTKVSPRVILAGSDRVAIDSVAVAILRYFGTTPEVQLGPVFGQQQIARAVELGLGVNRPEEIDFVTPDPESASFAQALREILIAL